MRLLALFVVAQILGCLTASAGTISFSDAGIPSGATLPVSVSVTFKNVGSNLEVDLFNNLAGTDPLQILSGLMWNVSGSAPTNTSLISAVTGGGSELFTSGTSGIINAELRNSVLGGQLGWQFLAPPGILNGTSFQFGLGASGLSGTFRGLGNASYGVIGPDSNIAHVPLHNQLPLVMSTSSSPSEAVFVIKNFNTDVSNIRDVTFAFGSAGNNNLIPAPEPSSLALGLAAIAGFYALVIRKGHRRQR
jgi:hypothetical protein